MDKKKEKEINLKTLAWIITAVVLVAAAVIAWMNLREYTDDNIKDISVTVVHSDGSRKSFSYTTRETYLGPLLTGEGLASGSKDAMMGTMIETVDGETADLSNDEWWALYRNGNLVDTVTDRTPIKNGDHIEVVFTNGF